MNLSEGYNQRLKELSGIIQEDRKRVEYLRGKFLSKYSNKQRKQAEQIFNQIVASDPSKNKQYSQWLLNLFSSNSLKIEDLYKATEYLYFFDELKRKNIVPADKKDIGKFTSIQQLYSLISELGGTGEVKDDEKYLLEDRFFINNKQAQLVFENGKWLVVIPKTFEASQFYGCSSQWCTKFPDQFQNYSKDGPLLVIIDKSKLNQHTNDRRYQFHFPSNQFMDFSDHQINLNNFLKDNPDLTSGLASFLVEAVNSGYNVLNAEEVQQKRNNDEERRDAEGTPHDEYIGNYLEFDILPPDAKQLILNRISDNGLIVSKSWLDMMDEKIIPTYIDNRLRKNGVNGFEGIWDLSDNRQKVYYFKKAASKGTIIPETIFNKADIKLIQFYLDEISKIKKVLPDFIYDMFSDKNKETYLNGISNLRAIDLGQASKKQISQLGADRSKRIIDRTIKNMDKFPLLLTNTVFDGFSNEVKNYYIGRVFQAYNGNEKSIQNVLTKHQLEWGREFSFLS